MYYERNRGDGFFRREVVGLPLYTCLVGYRRLAKRSQKIDVAEVSGQRLS